MVRILILVLLAVSPLCLSAQQTANRRMKVLRTTPTYIIYSGSDNNGVMVEAADGTVVGYTDAGGVDEAMHSNVFRQILNNIPVVNGARWAGSRRRVMAAEGGVQPTASQVRLLTDLWHQYYEPYNLMAPVVEGEHCVSGCVALAMAQVMHYYRWPKQGTGSHTYDDSLGCAQIVSSDFSAHRYDWDAMLDDYEGDNYTQRQADAVAQLLYDCGVSVDMCYGVGASGANSSLQPKAMAEYFGYDRSAQIHFRDFYTLDEWTRMLRAELDALRPVLFSGYSMHLGHAFVCDGYDDRGYFHFSFGNPNGEGDGYFYLPYLTPDFPPGQRPEEAESGFNLLQVMATRIMPVNSPDATGVETHVYAMSGMAVADTVVEGVARKDFAVVKRLCNIGWNEHTDSVSLVLQRNGECAAKPYTYDRQFLLEEFDDTTYTDTVAVGVPDGVADGTYKLVPMFKDVGEWKEVRTSVGMPNYLIANVKGGELSLREDAGATATLTMDSYHFPDWLPLSCTPDFSVTVRCHGTDFCGRIYVVLEAEGDSAYSVVMQERGLTMSEGEVLTCRFYHTWLMIPEGTYTLRISYDHDLFAEEDIVFPNLPEHRVVVSKTCPASVEDLVTDGTGDSEPIYNLQGIRIDDAVAAKGVNIKGGRKFMRR